MNESEKRDYLRTFVDRLKPDRDHRRLMEAGIDRLSGEKLDGAIATLSDLARSLPEALAAAKRLVALVEKSGDDRSAAAPTGPIGASAGGNVKTVRKKWALGRIVRKRRRLPVGEAEKGPVRTEQVNVRTSGYLLPALIQSGMADNSHAASQLVLRGRVSINGAPAITPNLRVGVGDVLQVNLTAVISSRKSQKLGIHHYSSS